MTQFCMEIAGQSGQISPLFESTRVYFQKYIAQKTPDFSYTVTREALEFEQEALRKEAEEEGMRFRTFTDPFLERASIQRAFAEHLLAKRTLLLHGSAIAADGLGYLFTAKCGTGKSTHTRLWMQHLGNRAVMINDDKPFLRLDSDHVLICGNPWSGKHGLDSNISVPLQGICLLDRGPENKISRMHPEEALPMLLHQSYHPTDPKKTPLYQSLVEELASRIPLWHMECTKDPEAAQVACNAMSGGGNP